MVEPVTFKKKLPFLYIHISKPCADNNYRRKTAGQTKKRDTKANMGRLSKRLDWLETIRPQSAAEKSDLMGHLQPKVVYATMNK